MPRKLTLRQRIGLSAGVLVLFVLVAGALGFGYARLSVDVLAASQAGVEQLNGLSAVERDAARLSAAVDQMLLTRQAPGWGGPVTVALQSFEGSLAALAGLSVGAHADTVAANAQVIGHLQQLGDEWASRVSSLQEEARRQRWEQAQALRQEEMAELQAQFDSLLVQLRRSAGADVETLVAQSAQRQRVTTLYLGIGLGLAVLGAILFTVIGLRTIVEPLHQLNARTRRVAGGDFSYVPPLERDDEIGQLAASFNVMTEWLADSVQVLEERVEERTHELTLAAEIGRRLGGLHDLEELLKEAVELIRSRFDLYYVQVYLIGADGKSLDMRAGSGDVGDELRRRGFRLPIDRGSLNGSAAYERSPQVIADTEHSTRFRANTLLPHTLSEIALPLLSGERVVGVLDLQSDKRYGLGEDNLSALEIVAGQLAIAVENAIRFSELRASQGDVEGQAQLRALENWATFMNGVERPERLAYTYSAGVTQEDTQTGDMASILDNSLSAPIELNSVPIGTIRLKGQPQQRWTPQDVEVVADIAQLVAQQVENLRLLAEAQRYRAEAEEALRRLTRESWREVSMAVGAYQYDGRQVIELPYEDVDHELAYPLQVRDQVVGELLVSGERSGADADTMELVSAVATRLSAHLENLRLSQQTEAALADVQRRSEELEELNRIVTRIAATLDLGSSLQIVVQELVQLTAADQARIGLLNPERTALTIVSEEFDEQKSPSALGLTIPVEGNALTQEVLTTRSTVVIADAQSHPLTLPIRAMLSEQGIRTMIVLPILAGNEVIGTVGADILTEGSAFSAEDLRLAETVVFQAATAIQNARLFEQIQSTLAETRALYRASAELNRARTYDDLLDVLRQHSVAGDGSSTISLALFERPWTDGTPPRWIDILAFWSAEVVERPKLRFALDEYPALGIMERERQTMISDVAADPRLDPRSRRALLSGLKARAVLAVPLVAGGQWIGHVNALYAEPRQFGDAALQQLQNLAGQAAVAVQSINLLEETSRLLESEQRQRRISDALVRASSRMLGVLDERHIRELVVDEIANLLNPEQIALYVWDSEGQALVLDQKRAPRGAAYDDYEVGQRLLPDKRPDLWQVLRSSEPRFRPLQNEHGMAPQKVVMPWQVGNDVAGVVELYYMGRGATLRDEDRASIEGIIRQAAIRLQSARLFDEAERRTAETEALYLASRTINTATSYQDVLQALSEHTVLGADSERVVIHYFDRPWNDDSPPNWVEVLARRDRRAGKVTHGRYRVSEAPAIRDLLDAENVVVLAENEAMRILDAGVSDPLTGPHESQSVLFVPLRAGGQWLGFVAAQYATAAALTDEEGRRLMALSSQAAATLQGLHLLQQAEVRAQRERVLREITEKVRSATDIDVIMKTAVREVGRALRRDAFVKLGHAQDAPGDMNHSETGKLNGRQVD